MSLKKYIDVCRIFPNYWEYDGNPVMLLGGSIEDNLFQINDLEEHLKILSSCGGNYVRCTMSSRDEGNVWPFHVLPDSGLYDLDIPSKDYWSKFEKFLEITYNLDIIVQIEIWDRFDFYKFEWNKNPFNPKNNCNYSSEESKLDIEYNFHPNSNKNRFFFSVPLLDNNQILLKYQKYFVDLLLERTLEYPHILYCMDNETSGAEEWSFYWSEYVKYKAEERGIKIHTTEMWDPWDISDDMHKRTFDHPDRYSFVEVSQNNHNFGDIHWYNLQRAVHYINSIKPRPVNNVKIYGNFNSRYGSEKDGLERFWRNIIGGCASARFHRPPSGIGLSETAQKHIKSARMILNEINIFQFKPCNDLLIEREENLAYLATNGTNEIVVFFTGRGRALTDVSKMPEKVSLKWLDIENSKWSDELHVNYANPLILETPFNGMQFAVVKFK